MTVGVGKVGLSTQRQTVLLLYRDYSVALLVVEILRLFGKHREDLVHIQLDPLAISLGLVSGG